jgi:hypothetical protein
MVAIGYRIFNGANLVEVNNPWAPNVGEHRFYVYDFWVQSPGHHVHWDDFYNVVHRR